MIANSGAYTGYATVSFILGWRYDEIVHDKVHSLRFPSVKGCPSNMRESFFGLDYVLYLDFSKRIPIVVLCLNMSCITQLQRITKYIVRKILSKIERRDIGIQ